MTMIHCTSCAAFGETRPDCQLCEGTGEVCERCFGAGYVRDVHDRIKPCSCGLVARRMAKALGDISILGGWLSRADFENFDIRAAPAAMPAYEAAVNFSRRPVGWLTIWSTTKGNGKTHLAAAACNVMNQSGRCAVLISVTDLLDYLRAGYDADKPSDQLVGRLTRIREADVLGLDDLGVEYRRNGGNGGMSWAAEQLYKILDYRSRWELPTLVTTNVALSNMESRIASRLQRNGPVIQNKAGEYSK